MADILSPRPFDLVENEMEKMMRSLLGRPSRQQTLRTLRGSGLCWRNFIWYISVRRNTADTNNDYHRILEIVRDICFQGH
jgi:hypothetical protein